jgi:hypothetical protein
MKTAQDWMSHPKERTYTVTLIDGTKRVFIGTHLMETADGDTIIGNGLQLVEGFKRSEFKDIQ